MRACVSLFVSLILVSSVAFGLEGITSKDADQLFSQLRENENQIKKFLLLYQEGAFFLVKLKSLGALSEIPAESHGKVNSGEANSRDLEKFGPLFPFEADFLLTVEEDPKSEYIFFVTKKNEESLWRLKKSVKRNIESKQEHSLPLPSEEQQSEANRLLKDEDKFNSH